MNITVLHAQEFVTDKSIFPGSFPVVNNSTPAAIYTDINDDWLVKKAAVFLQADINKVAGATPDTVHDLKAQNKNIIIVGSISGSSLIKQLIKAGKINVNALRNKWEAYQLQVVNNPFPKVDKALVIIGSDKRGTAYGVFELSKQIGVSPWYWWADVPVKMQSNVFVKAGTYTYKSPAVKYRGFFINDEAPALAGWAREKFGGFNHNFYEKVFELLLRMRANYLWPAMWGNAFNDDDPVNPVLADQYGIVMGTSHHEPMLRAQQEWKKYGSGEWNYDKNKTTLQNFWKKGIENMGKHESIVTVGMRGDGDMPMSEESNISLLENIVADQRKIITSVTGKNATATPQLWALYKEVQDYYDKGMRVPDDVTLLLCDDNWGNVRRLPKLSDKPRKGGYGMYYHFDYVGGPRNYKWLNTNLIPRIWEQMHLTYEYGVDRIWIVNVGDIKPMELPTQFFLDYAWSPNDWPLERLQAYTYSWAKQQFGQDFAIEIASMLTKYTQYNARRKPELLDVDTYSLTNYREAEKVVADYNALSAKAEEIGNALPGEYKDGYYQLVLYPIKACANLNDLYVTVAQNRDYAKRNDPKANELARRARELYKNDSLLALYYNKTMSNGKWNHMMDQTHIGYTYWQQPLHNTMPEVMEVKVSGNVEASGVKEKEVEIVERSVLDKKIYEEANGYISIAADKYSRVINGKNIEWQRIPDIGKTGSGITIMPVTAATQVLNKNTPHLEYDVVAETVSNITAQIYCSPTLNFKGTKEGLRLAVSFDDEQPQVLSINANLTGKTWDAAVADNIIIVSSKHHLSAGKHVLKIWMIDPAIVMQKIVLDFGGVKQSYLGPPEMK